MPELPLAPLRRSLASLLLLGTFGACDAIGGGGDDAAAVGDSATEGLSTEQMENQVQPMSPEQAQQLGVVDSTTDLDQPSPVGEEMVIPGSPADTAPAPR